MMVLDTIQNLIHCNATLDVYVHPVVFVPARDFTTSLKKVLDSAGEALSHDYLASLLRPVRSYAYRLAQMPIPLNHPELFPAEGLEQLRLNQRKLEQSYPSLTPHIKALLEHLELLSIADDAPLLEKILQLDDQPQAILIQDTRSAAGLSRHLESMQVTEVDVVTSKRLKVLTSYSSLAVAGPVSRYPEHVLLSPRAPRIDIVRYDWTYDVVEQRHPFTHSTRSHKLKIETVRPAQKPGQMSGVTPEDLPLINLEDLRPSVNVTMLARREQVGNNHDLVSAKLIVLEDDQGVFLEEDSTVFLVNPELPAAKRVSRCEVTRLSAGDFVVLRTEGGGDYVAEVADRILRDNAKTFRERQLVWKTELKKTVAIKGMDAVKAALVRAGVLSASRTNIRNWSSTKNLGMQSLKDFEVVLDFLGLGKDTALYIEALRALRKAHRSAGHQIRQQLIDRITSLDPEMLEQQGHLDIELEDAEGGRLSIYRVINLPEGAADIPEGRLGDLVPLT